MKQVFILQNQHKQFLTKQGEWTDGRDGNSLYRTEHKDEAINQQFEASSKDYTLRLSLIQCNLNERGVPIVPVDNLSDAMGMPDVVAAEVNGGAINGGNGDNADSDSIDDDGEDFILADINLDGVSDVAVDEDIIDEDAAEECVPENTDREDITAASVVTKAIESGDDSVNEASTDLRF